MLNKSALFRHKEESTQTPLSGNPVGQGMSALKRGDKSRGFTLVMPQGDGGYPV